MSNFSSKGIDKVQYHKAITMSETLQPQMHYLATKEAKWGVGNSRVIIYRTYRTFNVLEIEGDIICSFLDEAELIKWEATHGIHN